MSPKRPLAGQPAGDDRLGGIRGKMKIFALLLALGAVIAAATPTDAKGCPVTWSDMEPAGAAAGCVIGHHEANKRQDTKENR